MPPTDQITTAAQADWEDTCNRSRTPQQYAAVFAARRYAASIAAADDPHVLVREYQRLMMAGAFGPLNELTPSASQIADLAIVVNGRTAGVRAQRLDGHTRTWLARHSLIVGRSGSAHPPDDWRGEVVATPAGLAIVRAAQGRPVILNDSEAVPLAVIARAQISSPERGSALWPGSEVALRVAQMWRLVEYVRLDPPRAEHWSGKLGKAVYRLTAEGVAALERHRSKDGKQPPVATGRPAGVLARVATQGRADLGVPDALTVTAIQKCLDAGWLKLGAVIPGTTRNVYLMTEEGRDALAGWRFREQTRTGSPELPTRTTTQIQPGQWVRLLHRNKVPGLGGGWVEVVEVRGQTTSTRAQLAHNYEVWVRTEARPDAYLYAGRSLHRAVRWEVRPL